LQSLADFVGANEIVLGAKTQETWPNLLASRSFKEGQQIALKV